MHFQLVAYIKTASLFYLVNSAGCSYLIKPYRVVGEEHQRWSEHHQPNKMYGLVWSFQKDVRYLLHLLYTLRLIYRSQLVL